MCSCKNAPQRVHAMARVRTPRTSAAKRSSIWSCVGQLTGLRTSSRHGPAAERHLGTRRGSTYHAAYLSHYRDPRAGRSADRGRSRGRACVPCNTALANCIVITRVVWSFPASELSHDQRATCREMTAPFPTAYGVEASSRVPVDLSILGDLKEPRRAVRAKART